jgi:arylsulfatase A-like enzyme
MWWLLLACTPDPQPTPAPTECASAQSLLTVPAKITGTHAPTGPVLRALPEELWTRETRLDRTVLRSPDLDQLEGAHALTLSVVPGAATHVEVVLKGPGDDALAQHRRRVELPLERDGDPLVAVELRAELDEMLRGNWQDDGNGSLDQVVVVLHGADAETELMGAALLNASAELDGRVAAVQRAEADGITQPAWVLTPSASVTLQVPSGELVAQITGTVQINGVLHQSEGWTTVRQPVQAGDLVFHSAGSGAVGEPRIEQPGKRCAPDVLVVMLDTVRSDRLGAHGYPAANTPTLDQLAATGADFTDAVSTSAWTKPAIVTLQTGVLPTTHQVGARGYSDRLPDDVDLLQERFRDAGYRTGSFSASPLGTSLSGLDRGFGRAVLPRHWAADIGPLRHPSTPQLQAQLIDWFDGDRPHFAYVHTLEAHQWMVPTYADGAQSDSDAYDRALADADATLGALLSALTRPTLVVVVSDHGESLGEHGLTGHGSALVPEQTEIPLILWGSGIAPQSIPDTVSLADVAPTLLDLAGLEPLPRAQGRSLAPLLQGAPLAAQPVPSDLLRHLYNAEGVPEHAWTDPTRSRIVRGDGTQLTRDRQGAQVPDDPGFSSAHDAHLAAQALAAEAWARTVGQQTGAINPTDVEALQALGYLEP